MICHAHVTLKELAVFKSRGLSCIFGVDFKYYHIILNFSICIILVVVIGQKKLQFTNNTVIYSNTAHLDFLFCIWWGILIRNILKRIQIYWIALDPIIETVSNNLYPCTAIIILMSPYLTGIMTTRNREWPIYRWKQLFVAQTKIPSSKTRVQTIVKKKCGWIKTIT